jgi:hypothetical protein
LAPGPAHEGPHCALVIEMHECGKSGSVAETVTPGDNLQGIGKRHYQSVVDAKRQLRTSQLTRSTWGIHQRVAAAVRAAAQAHAGRGFNIIAR